MPASVRPGVLLALLVALGVGLALGVRMLSGPPAGAVEPVWDRTPCARCRMLVSDPSFAAQLHASDGSVLHFDDPGCLLLHLAEQKPEVVALWFHHHAEERWLPGESVRFVATGPTPMGYGLGASDDAGASGLDTAAATARLAAAGQDG